MLKIKRIAVAISGGVDSAVATLLLKKKGYDVHAVFMQNWDIIDETGICQSDEDYKDAVHICKKLDVPLHRINFVKEYWNKVFSNLLSEYQNGHTPNPDVLCNKYVKFDSFFKYSQQRLNVDAIATGHYARNSFGPYLEHFNCNEDAKLLIPKDSIKDQTLFLCQISQEALKKTMFPLSELTKLQVKNIAKENGFQQIATKKESMGICFIGLRNFQKFISDYIKDNPGKFINLETGQVVGQHDGIHQWTLGQRTKISGVSTAFFTVKKNTATNDIYVVQGTNHPALFTDLLYTSKPHWIASPPVELTKGMIYECDFKFQHVDNLISCQIATTTEGLIVLLKSPLRSLTSGQFAVFYQGQECLGSARIIAPGPSLFNLHWPNNNIEREEDLTVWKENLFFRRNEIKYQKICSRQ